MACHSFPISSRATDGDEVTTMSTIDINGFRKNVALFADGANNIIGGKRSFATDVFYLVISLIERRAD